METSASILPLNYRNKSATLFRGIGFCSLRNRRPARKATSLVCRAALPLSLRWKLLEHLLHHVIDHLSVFVRFAADRLSSGPAPNVSLGRRVADIDDESPNRKLLHFSDLCSAASPTSPASSPTPTRSPPPAV